MDMIQVVLVKGNKNKSEKNPEKGTHPKFRTFDRDASVYLL